MFAGMNLVINALIIELLSLLCSHHGRSHRSLCNRCLQVADLDPHFGKQIAVKTCKI